VIQRNRAKSSSLLRPIPLVAVVLFTSEHAFATTQINWPTLKPGTTIQVLERSQLPNVLQKLVPEDCVLEMSDIDDPKRIDVTFLKLGDGKEMAIVLCKPFHGVRSIIIENNEDNGRVLQFSRFSPGFGFYGTDRLGVVEIDTATGNLTTYQSHDLCDEQLFTRETYKLRFGEYYLQRVDGRECNKDKGKWQLLWSLKR
jgi:hypothetical protein